MLLPFFWPSQIPSFIAPPRDICFALFLKWGVIWGGTRDNGAKKGWRQLPLSHVRIFSMLIRVGATSLPTWDFVAYDDRLPYCLVRDTPPERNRKYGKTKQSPRCSWILNRRNPTSHRVVRSTLMTLRQEEKKAQSLDVAKMLPCKSITYVQNSFSRMGA
jgi:hypothetical protein